MKPVTLQDFTQGMMSKILSEEGSKLNFIRTNEN